jgi:hypothetical protein
MPEISNSNKPYSVNHWCSHPDASNDDCSTGDEFATLEEAVGFFNKPAKDHYIAFIEIDGPDIYLVRANPHHNAKLAEAEERESRRGEAREHAYQIGMAFGCSGYNDAMGWG